MAQEVFGEYAGYTTPGGVRFQYQGKLISKNAIPPEVVSFLTNKLEGKPRGFPRPTPAELEKIKAEQLAPKPGLEADPAKLAADAANAAERLSTMDFEDPEPPVDPSPPEEVPEGEELFPAELPLPSPTEVDPSFLESVSIHTAPLGDLAQALYNRFGIYTVYLRKLPEGDEVNPLTATAFTKYHLGIAYQAAIFAQNQGVLDLPAEEGRKSLDQGRAAHENFAVDERPHTMGEARRANSFDFRTSVRANETNPTHEIVHVKGADGKTHAVQREIPAGQIGSENGAGQRFDKEEDEQLVEPRFGKQVIRPNW